MELIFQDANGEERVIANVETDEEAMDEVMRFCSERNFTVHYTRGWHDYTTNRTHLDVGSHTEFFILQR